MYNPFSSLFPSQDATYAANQNYGYAEDAVIGGLSAAGAGIGAAQDSVAFAKAQADKANAYGAKAGQSAADMGQSILDVKASATKVGQQAETLRPYQDLLKGYGSDLWTQGLGIAKQGQGVLDSGLDILNLNDKASGISGEMVSWIRSLDPNRLVSQATSDIQASYDNASGQLSRRIGRTGGSVTGGNALSMQAALTRSLVAALAGGKTRARQAGNDERGKALTSAATTAQGLISSGNSVLGTGLSSQTAGASVTKSAADIGGIIAQLFGTEGTLNAQAGTLGAQQAAAYTSAGKLFNDAASTVVAAGGQLQQSLGTMASMELKAADYYNGQANRYDTMAAYFS